MIVPRVLLVVFTIASLCSAQSEGDRAKLSLDPGALRADVNAATDEILRLTNAFRGENGLGALKPDPALTATATEFARFMAGSHKYGHEADGRTPAERAEANKYDYCLVLENIALQFRSDGFATGALAGEFVQAWKDSPGHRKNMLNPHVVECGMAVAMSENGVYYAVQMFGRPKSMSFDVRIENRSRTAVRYTLDDQAFDVAPRVIRTHTLCIPPAIKFSLPEGSKPPKDDQLAPARATTYVITDAPRGVAVNVTPPKK